MNAKKADQHVFLTIGQKNDHAVSIDRETELDKLSARHRQYVGRAIDDFVC